MLHTKRKKGSWSIYKAVSLYLLEIILCLGLLGIYSPYIPSFLSFITIPLGIIITLRILLTMFEEISFFKNW